MQRVETYAFWLSFLSYAFVGGAIRLCLPPLFPEISASLNLSKTQIGTIWGMDPLAGFFVSLWAGLLIDRFGIKRTLSAVCICSGIAGALRAVCKGFGCLSSTMFLFGVFATMVPTMGPKVTSIFFMGRNLGSINGMMQLGMTGGSIIGTLFAATVVSPLVGGWRGVLVLYAIPPMVIGALWFAAGGKMDKARKSVSGVPFREALQRVVRRKEIWCIGISSMGLQAAFVGIAGYLPSYLRTIGWTSFAADAALSVFAAISAATAFPISFASDRIGSRKLILIPLLLGSSVSLFFFPLEHRQLLWLLIAINGISRGAVFPLSMSLLVEQRGIGPRYAGTASGAVLSLGMLGAFAAQPLGMYVAEQFGESSAFVAWGIVSFVTVFPLFFVHEERRSVQVSQALSKAQAP